MKKHTFLKGKRYLHPGEPLQIWQPGKVKELVYNIRFDESIRYNLLGEEQEDWLKGGGASFSLLTNHKNSVMWAFRYNPITDKVEINLYAHIAKRVYYPRDPVLSVPVGEEFTVRIFTDRVNNWTVLVQTKTASGQHTVGVPNKSCCYRRIPAYFGGTLPAPQDVNMYMDFYKN